ncbi:MAG: PilC/PilY family type IV pilus protein, partial [Gammaproteobacteria bacterium]|nr:PilC/PilY family type IV pilus protein [Gammaproteobacteria bacterium]
MDRSDRTQMSAFLGGLLLTLSQAGNAVTISQMPLFIAAGVTPNVMLVVDNSGSMNSIIWAKAYNPTVTYPDWSPMVLTSTNCTTGTNYEKGWLSTDGSVTHTTLVNTRYRGTCGGVQAPPTCGAGLTRGRNTLGTVTKCLTLPDPVTGGNTRYSGNYLNYLFNTYANNTNLTTGTIPNDFRMRVARNVATNVVNNNTNTRLGLTVFNTDQGGRVLNTCATGNTASLVTSIAGLTASTWTPLGETLYEVTRYFRGMSSYYNSSTSYTSPIQYRCQKSFVIVITDGYPTQDTDFPSNDPADVANTSAALPNWDGLAPLTLPTQYPNFPSGSDGFQPAGTATQEGHTLYLDDVAKFAYDTDMRATGNDLTGVSFNDPLFPKQNLVTYTVGFAVANQMMADAARLGTGTYLLAGNEAELTAALQAALADIEARTSSAASVATNSTRLASNTFIYQARFSSGDWGGQLLAYPIGAGGAIATLDEVTGVPVLGSRSGWNSSSVMPAPASRKIYTYNPGPKTGMEFVWSALTSAQQTALNTNVSSVNDGLGQQRLDYLRGDRTNELPGGPFRARSSIMGDIINSDPTFVGNQNFGFDLLPGAEGTSYKTFRQSTAYKDRRPVVYVAANDGMLHGFDAETGVELLAYMPNAVYPMLRYLTDPSFNSSHRLINDGAPKSLDAYINGGWKTVLLGTLGGGGKGVYALDVTAPSSFSATRVLWEFTSANDSKMGDAIPQATIARMYNGKWAAIVSNGYNSSTGNAVLFVIDLETGVKIKEFDTGVGSDNGLASATPVDVDGDRITDYIYAGDLKGN